MAGTLGEQLLRAWCSVGWLHQVGMTKYSGSDNVSQSTHSVNREFHRFGMRTSCTFRQNIESKGMETNSAAPGGTCLELHEEGRLFSLTTYAEVA
jgi:hypothetical protein